MFRKSKNQQQLNLFNSTVFLNAQSLKEYENDKNWHNIFYTEITEKIVEEIFRELFCENNGAPNYSIRVLVAMLILKAARGCSDAQLFEDCKFNLLVRRALGLVNANDKPPAESTYYRFKSLVEAREKAGLGNLIEEVFISITKAQIKEFNISGSKIRLDSTLIGSNLAWNGRYALIHESLRVAYKKGKSEIENFLTKLDKERLQQLSIESGENISYHSNKTELETRLNKLGALIYKIVLNTQHTQNEEIKTLHQVFSEHFEVVEGVVKVLPKEKIKSNSIQSPHDTDSRNRSKGEQKVTGFSGNITETCDENNPVNLITNVILAPATTSDVDFLQPAIEATQEILEDEIETINADGGYHSPDNQDFCRERRIDLILSAISGAPSRYDLEIAENGDLLAYDRQNKKYITAIKSKSYKGVTNGSWYITTEEGKRKYFSIKNVETCQIRRLIDKRSLEELYLRNNVEATAFQLCYHLSGKKSRYRGLFKHKIWALLRCIWINFARIMKYLKNGGLKPINTSEIRCIFRLFLSFFANLLNFHQKLHFFCKI